MSWNGVVKENPRVQAEEIYSYISSKTSLKRDQVMECFNAYSQMLKEIYGDKNTDKELTVSLPHIGKFYVIKKKGRKDGTKYILPNLYGGEDKIVIAKNEPSFYSVKLKVNRGILEYVKEKTSHIEK